MTPKTHKEMETIPPMEQAQPRSNARWTFLITAVALLMVVLDNLVVSTALPTIRTDLKATLEGLEWTVNAYTLTFAVLLLPAAALGDRFGRRRMFVFGLTLFTLASAGAALSNSIETLIIARALQGTGAAFVVPLTLTLLSAAVPADRRGVALGAWGAIGGLAVALGPLVGGAIVEGINWHWIFWLNVPIGLVLIPFGWLRLTESRGPADKLDIPGVLFVAVGLLAVVWAVIKGNELGWASAPILISFAIGIALLAAFAWWERRATAPMLPLTFFKSRAFSMANLASLLMYFGMFGAIFLLSQYLQIVLHNSPFQAGLKILPWTLAPIFIAPIAGASSDRIGGGVLMGVGLAMQAIGLAWLGLVVTPTVDYAQLVHPVHRLGHRHGPVLRAGRERRAERRPTQGGRPGVGRQQRHPRGRRGVRGGHPGLRVQQLRRLRDAAATFVDGLRPAILIGAAVRGPRLRGGVRHPAPGPHGPSGARRRGRRSCRRARRSRPRSSPRDRGRRWPITTPDLIVARRISAGPMPCPATALVPGLSAGSPPPTSHRSSGRRGPSRAPRRRAPSAASGRSPWPPATRVRVAGPVARNRIASSSVTEFDVCVRASSRQSVASTPASSRNSRCAPASGVSPGAAPPSGISQDRWSSV